MNPASSIARGVDVGQIRVNTRARPRVGLAVFAWLSILASCADVNGGAVELSWLLRPSNGDESTCSDQSCCRTAEVAQIRLNWSVDGISGSDAWRCDDNRAVTRFEVPPGAATLWVVPECAGGPASSEFYEAPPPVVRTLVAGEVVSLNAVVVQVQVADCGLPACVCH
jgi:hypothetical protein